MVGVCLMPAVNLLTLRRRKTGVSLTISDTLLQVARMSEAELRQEIAVMLFQREKLTLAQASRFAHMSRLQFQHVLASRQIPVHYDVNEFEEDIQTLQRLGRL
jgi:predicted HTH domain antitoxin